MTPEEMDEVVAEFLTESRENIDALDKALLVLEQDPGDDAALGAVFRSMHTIKGASGFLGFDHLTSLTHSAESLLAGLRDGTVLLEHACSRALFSTVDAVRALLGTIEATGGDGDEDYGHLVAELTRLQQRGQERAPVPEAVSPPDPEQPAAEPVAPESPVAPAAPDSASPAVASAPSTIRVRVSLLDELMNLVGELVLTRNQILQCTAGHPGATFSATAQRLNLITTELQEGVMKTRMQPIGMIWNKFPRVVRDVSLACGKQIGLEMEGSETELDRTLIEAMTDPLTHLVRNAVDHGVERPEDRLAAGKAAAGRLSLRAYHEGGHVNIEISDDGGGIDIGKVRERARAQGLLRNAGQGATTDRELINLIFSPGFSTAHTVTGISGRGVGLDVVRTNVERIGGTVEVSSELGCGTTFRIKIPLTLAIVPALVVTAAGERYAIPQVNLVELLRLSDERSPAGIEYVHGVPVHRLHGTLLPLVDLGVALGLREEGAGLGGDGAVSVVVVQALDRQFGLVVDDIGDTEEIVVKPLGAQLKQVETFAGATIMGDGRVALILDVTGIARRAGVVSGEDAEVAGESSVDEGGDRSERATLLLLGVGEDRRMAVHLSDVDRLEEFSRRDVEHAGDEEVVRYRGRILPLLPLGRLLGLPGEVDGASDKLQVVVHDDGRDCVGLVVDRILDIVEDDLVLDPGRAGGGLLGSAVVADRVTDVVDVPALLAAAGRRPRAGVAA